MTKALFLFLIGLMVVGCTPSPSTEGGTMGHYEEINVNGTRCIVWDGYKAGGIDCDFPSQ